VKFTTEVSSQVVAYLGFSAPGDKARLGPFTRPVRGSIL